MANSTLLQDFQKGPEHFLKKYALVNPGNVNFDVAPAGTAAVNVNEHLGYGGKAADLARAKPASYDAKAKTLTAVLNFKSTGGGNASSGWVNGFENDHKEPKSGLLTLSGNPQVELSVGLDLKDGLPIYFLPWKGDNTITMTLSQEARFFVTAAMTGCTFQVTGPPEAPVVSHANAGGRDAGEKLGWMDGLLKKAIEDKIGKHWTPGKQHKTTRLQTGLWGASKEKGLREVNYAADDDSAKKAWDSKISGLQRDKNTYSTGEIEVEEVLDGNYKHLTVAVVGWRPPGEKRWEFYYQVWADFNLERRVYRKEKRLLGGTKRKTLEKSKICDFVLLVPGTKLWPEGKGWPEGKVGKVSG
ncbi:MAG TPA: hypothetical protein VK615_01225 [Candidatus Binatia bacterium]|nr:hypothetical protein [Candidatus Binatia bacterium]